MSPEPSQAVRQQGQLPATKQPLIPKKTQPLGKFVRTGEGILVFAFNLAMLIVPIFSSALTPGQAVKWAGIVNGVAVFSRTGLKIVSVIEGVTDTTPTNVVSQPVATDIDQLATAIAQNLPKDLASTPTIDQVGAQIEEIRGLVARLATDSGAVAGAGASAQRLVSDDMELASSPVEAEIDAPHSELLPSDDEEFASMPADAKLASGTVPIATASVTNGGGL